MAEDSSNPNLSNLPDEPGSFEVEDMPESNELQERRRKTKNRLQELSNVEGGSGSGTDDAFDEDEESGLMDLLKEANLSPRHLKSCCGGILVLVLIIALFFGAKSAWTYWKNRPVEEDPVVEELPETVPDSDAEDYSFLDPSLLGGILVGEDQSENDLATDLGEVLGDNTRDADTFSNQLNDFAKIFESLQVDVNELLNHSSDRLNTLREYESELKYHLYLAKQNLEKLQNESNSLSAKFIAVENSKDDLERDFFVKIQNLDAPAANAALGAFVEQGQEIVRLRALFNARQKLISYYEQALGVLELRITDITLNEEALVKGVRVVELEGSTLDLIINEEDL